MRNPHTVRLDGPDGSLMITNRVSDLEFTNIENGGYGSGSFTLDRPISRRQLDTFAEVLVFDSRNGQQVGGGRILTPGRSATDRGQVSNVAFLGEGVAAMQDIEAPYFLIDGNLDYWHGLSRNTRDVSQSTTTFPTAADTDDPVLLFQAVAGQTINVGAELKMANRLPELTGQIIGGIGWQHKAGVTNGNWQISLLTFGAGLSGATAIDTDTWSTTFSGRLVATVATIVPAGRRAAGLWWRRVTSNAVAAETTYNGVFAPKIRAQIYGQDGVLRTAGYNNEYVLAHEAFIDWAVRNCPTLDIENAHIDQGTYQFDQLSWADGITGTAMLEEIFSMEQTLMWGAFEKTSDGLHRVELRTRPTEVRYEVSINDGYEDAGANDELYNVAFVVWKSPAGRAQMTRVPASGVSPVPELDAVGRVQSKTLNLGDEVGSALQATRKGEEFLAAHSVIPNGGTLTINGARRVYDRVTHRFVAPWEILPGYLCRIRGLYPRPDTLNPDGGADGNTIARIVSMNWQDSRGSAQLQLDSYPLDQYHMIADLMKTRRVTRRG